MSKSELIEQALCHTNQVPNDTSKECDVKIDEITTVKVLVIKSNNKLSCLAARCTHYSVPLKMGVIYKGRLRCMAHGACFDTQTGDIEDYPGPDCLPKFHIYVENETIYIKATRQELESKSRLKTKPEEKFKIPTCSDISPKKSISTKCLIIGSGAAGSTCADVLREHGLTDITVLSADSHLPYDRPKLSKKLDVTFEQCSLRSEEYMKEAKIKYQRSEVADDVDFGKKIVVSKSGSVYGYDKLVIATGFRANRMAQPGNDLKGVFTLRSLDDANNIRDHFEKISLLEKPSQQPINVILIGGSFISMETASFFIENNANTLVMGRSPPFEKTFGPQVSAKILQLHESKGVKFYNDSKFEIKRFIESSTSTNSISEIELVSGERFPCDICLLALGGSPCTEFLKNSGLKMNGKNLVIVDKNMETSVRDVYAAGDITSFPRACLPGLDVQKNGDLISIGHWGFAMSQGRSAGLSLINGLGDKRVESELKVVPFFWSSQFGKNIRFSGFSDRFDSIIFHEGADKAELKFVAFYVFMDRVVGVCSMGWDPMCAIFAEALYNGIEVRPEHVELDPNGLKELLV